jgi:hypothetical protein
LSRPAANIPTCRRIQKTFFGIRIAKSAAAYPRSNAVQAFEEDEHNVDMKIVRRIDDVHFCFNRALIRAELIKTRTNALACLQHQQPSHELVQAPQLAPREIVNNLPTIYLPSQKQDQTITNRN